MVELKEDKLTVIKVSGIDKAVEIFKYIINNNPEMEYVWYSDSIAHHFENWHTLTCTEDYVDYQVSVFAYGSNTDSDIAAFKNNTVRYNAVIIVDE
jgi:hypothetical protein